MTEMSVSVPADRSIGGERPRRPHEERAAWGLVGPAAALIGLILVVPLALVVALSLTDYQLGAKAWRFVGLANYADLASDPVFWRSIANTALYAVAVVAGSTGLGRAVALALQGSGALAPVWRTIFFLPVMASLVAMAIVWEFMLHPTFGLVNAVLGLVGIAPVNWLQNGATALPALAAIGIWQQFGFAMVLFLAGLSGIPTSLYDAAEMDGAPSAWARFRLVTWPLLAPVTLFVVVISTIRSFQVFDTVHALTKGGPNKATEVLLYTMYAEGFEFFRTGRAAAIAVVFVAAMLVVTLTKVLLVEKRIHAR
ncbi:MAG: sugar ABC transporter permease [Phyllobacteriaceae bacterium]|nr:sugar ABC transporter permease [Phyllobacteriaceae bacterium]